MSAENPQISSRVWGVGALCRAVADALDARFNPVAVRGEISGFSRAVSGHCYFSIKDATGQIRCAMFKRAAGMLDFSPKDGELVELRGRLGVYEARGDLQLVVESMRRAGQGALFEQFLRLKAQLEGEGLFDPAHKRDLPLMPRAIGVVTSLGAAAWHDVVTALQRRVPHIPVRLAPAAVQGAGAAQALVQALQQLYAQTALHNPSTTQPVDVILLVRGGGSMEDLWSFNDEQLARTMAVSPVPIICGVGHETDFTIADFVADVRAPRRPLRLRWPRNRCRCGATRWTCCATGWTARYIGIWIAKRSGWTLWPPGWVGPLPAWRVTVWCWVVWRSSCNLAAPMGCVNIGKACCAWPSACPKPHKENCNNAANAWRVRSCGWNCSTRVWCWSAVTPG